MGTQAVGTQATETSERGKNTLDKHDFLQLLVTQLRLQNPLDPLSDQEFSAQLAQYSALEEMQNANKSLQSLLFLNASSLVGKEVELTDGMVGKVEGVTVKEEQVVLEVGEREYNISEVVKVGES
ncbi:MAG TPA: flagellar hook capping FlgD N-terminal domain-containing protein [Candidatus Atribacteria bacterium]|nr:flagellar hook capping FlgD N-terminal domain-containing protein [Candidatus Atribacteria bacterium]